MLAFGCAKSTGTRVTRLSALGDARLDVIELDVVSVVGLDVGGETVEGALDSLLGGAVHHTRLFMVSGDSFDFQSHGTYVLRRVIGSPRDEGDLGSCTLTTVKLVLNVEYGVTAANTLLALAVLALCVEELLAEDRPVSLLGCLLDDDLLPVVADLVDDPLDVLAELELVESADALRCDGDTAVVSLVNILEVGCAWRCRVRACARRMWGAPDDSCQGLNCMNGGTYPD